MEEYFNRLNLFLREQRFQITITVVRKHTFNDNKSDKNSPCIVFLYQVLQK